MEASVSLRPQRFDVSRISSAVNRRSDSLMGSPAAPCANQVATGNACALRAARIQRNEDGVLPISSTTASLRSCEPKCSSSTTIVPSQSRKVKAVSSIVNLLRGASNDSSATEGFAYRPLLDWGNLTDSRRLAANNATSACSANREETNGPDGLLQELSEDRGFSKSSRSDYHRDSQSSC